MFIIRRQTIVPKLILLSIGGIIMLLTATGTLDKIRITEDTAVQIRTFLGG